VNEKKDGDAAKGKQPLPIVIGLLVLITVLTVILGISRMQRLLYEERTANLSKMMEKIGQNIDVVLNTHWDDAYYCARDLCREQFATRSLLIARIDTMQSFLPEGINCFLIDGEGICHASDGSTFRWGNNAILAAGEEHAYVTSVPGAEGEYLFFPVDLPSPLYVEGNSYQHFALACDMRDLDAYFDVGDFGQESTTFVVRKNGTAVYRQKRENSMSEIYNVLEFLRLQEVRYSLSGNAVAEDIEQGVSGCAVIHYQGGDYFAAYQQLESSGWFSVLLVPSHLVGVNSMHFLGSVIAYFAVLSILVLAVLSTLMFASSVRIQSQQQKIHESLRQAAETEKNANQAKSRFLSSMSHDIRTPMNAITGMASIALAHLDDRDKVESCLHKITLSSRHLLTLINDVLDISKIESGKMVLNPVSFSLRETVSTLSDIVRPQIRVKNQQFEMRIRGIEKEHLYADELRISQVFINLLTNAVKYTPEGGKITLDLCEEVLPDEKNVRLTYVVSDTGIGMSKEFMAVMYDAFSQAQDHRVTGIHGTGLGLAIVRQMVELMGGTVDCQSEEGKGTTFTVVLTLPVAPIQEEEAVLPGLEVLLIDDDSLFLETAQETFDSLKIQLETASGGEEGVRMAEARHESGRDYSVIIIDWKMPGMSGLATAEAIRKVSSAPVIFISAYDWVDLEDDVKAAAVDGFIAKPLFRSTVYEKLCGITGRKRALPEPEEELGLRFSGKRLLIAEDNDLNWEIISELLSMYGIYSERAENGRICIEKLSAAPAGRYDMILMDVQMPVMNGREAAEAIRRDERPWIKEIPIVAMTADAFAEDIAACLKSGMNGHVSKPVDMKKLCQEMSKALEERDTQTPAEPAGQLR